MPKTHELQIEGHKIVAWEYNADMATIPAFMMHGIGSSLAAMEPVATPLFAERFHWFSLSLPGHYPAVFPANPRAVDAEMIARVLTAAIRALVGDQPVLLGGYSTGGFAALDMAAHAPEMARGVLSISGFATGKWTGVLGMQQRLVRSGALGTALFKSGWRVFGSTTRLMAFSMRYYTADQRAAFAHPSFQPLLAATFPNLRQINYSSLALYFRDMPDIDITPLLSRITAPTLVIAGDHDPIVPPAQSQRIADHIPGSKLVVLKGAGHMPMLERADEYHRAISDWAVQFL